MKTCPACQETYPDDTAFCLLDGTRLADPIAVADAHLTAGLSRQFRIIRRLGKGGMGTVFLAEQLGVGNRPVALKVLNRKFLDDADFLQRFQNEAGSTGRIHHLNIVTIHESAQGDDGTPYIAMEYLEGESLRNLLHRSGALSVKETAEILVQAARGLNAAHKLGIIHRDLKPDNIFLTHGDEGELIVKVVDFGIAKLRESAMHTQTGMVLGTPAYMSSEQAYGMRSAELDARSDIYSLGVVVYEMLTGSLPFYADTPTGFLRKHINEEPPPFKTIAPNLDLPLQLEAVVMKALKKKREERYQSALEFAHAFVAAAPTDTEVDVGQPLRSTVVVTEEELDGPTPVTEDNQGPIQRASQAPSKSPFGGKAAAPAGGRQRRAVIAEDRQQTAQDVTPPPRPAPVPSAKVKVAVIVGVVLILAVAGVWHSLPSPKPPGQGPEVDRPQVAGDDPIAGCYQWFNGGAVAIRADHTVQGGPFTGSWQLLDAAQRSYLIRWPQPTTSSVKLSADQRSLAGENQYGGKDVATRLAGSYGLVGTWRWFDMVPSTVVVNSDGTWSAMSSSLTWDGTWHADMGSFGTYTMTASDVPKDKLTLASDGSRLSGADQYGIAISGVRTGSCP
jgi:serine/threonine protein kinase